jgi:tetratricopeptide (TPR) repeat protein
MPTGWSRSWTEVGIKGSLREASLADVCQLLSLGRKTGCLSVTDGSRFGQIFFDRGQINYARVVNRRDRIGDLMVHDGVLAQEQLQEVLEVQAREPERKLGELLVDRGAVSRDALLHYIRLQIEEAVFHLFTWSRGSFYFEPDGRPEDADVLVSINPESLLLEAARRVDEWSLIEKKIPSLDLIFQIEHDRIETSRDQLTAEQRTLVRLLDGTRTVQEIVDRTGLLEFDAGKALYGLVQAGLARRVGRRTETQQARPRQKEITERRNLGAAFYRAGMLDDAEQEFERILELDPHDRAARFQVGIISAAAGRYRQAIRHFRLVLEEGGPQYSAFVNLAHALRAVGRSADALLVLDEAESLRPRTPGVALARAVALLESNDLANAVESFDQYRRRLPPSVPPAAMYYYYAALATAMSRDLEGAEALLDEGLGSHPGSAPLLLLRGLIPARRGDMDAAETWLRRAVEEDGGLAHAYRALGDLAFDHGDYDDALGHYLRVIELAPDLSDEVHARIGTILYRARQYEAAVRHWHRAIALNPANHVARSHIDIVAHAGG